MNETIKISARLPIDKTWDCDDCNRTINGGEPIYVIIIEETKITIIEETKTSRVVHSVCPPKDK